MKKKKGFFITFEGAEGGGKSTQIARADAYLRKTGHSVLLLREPGGTRVSEAIREIILNKHFKEMSRQTELLLYLAARAQLVREKILPALEKGGVVICDRFEDSSLAYQGYGREIPVHDIRDVSRLLVRGRLEPDLTFILDIDPKIGMKRGGRTDRMELESLKFHQKVREGFLDLARRNPKRYRVIDALQEKEAVAERIREILNHVLG
jgi:dTMP kinase